MILRTPTRWLPRGPLAVLMVMGLLAACSSETTDESEAFVPAPTSAPGLAMVSVIVDPPAAAPGSVVQVTARVYGAREAEVTLVLPGGTTLTMPTTEPGEGYLTTSMEVTTLARTGDQVFAASGTSDIGPLCGHGLFTGVVGATCAVSEVYEAGACRPKVEGHLLEIEAVATIGNMAALSVDDARNMQHPRALEQVGYATVGCHTDHIGIVNISDYEQMAVLLDEDALDPLGDDEEGEDEFTPVTETLLEVAGLAHCEGFALDEGTRLAVSSSRGTFGEDGGLAVWRIPDLTQPPPWSEPEFLSVVTSPDGYEGVVLRDRVLYAAKKPNRVTTWSLGDDGQLTPLADIEVPELISAWDIEVEGDLLFVSDPGSHAKVDTASESDDGSGDLHYNHAHEGGAGRFFVVDVADPADPQPIGFADTIGAAKGMAILPGGFLVVSSGAAGFEVFDTAIPAEPVAVALVDTPGTANDVAYRDGYLLVADWDSARLYDVTEPRTPRFLEANDVGVMSVLESQWEAEVLAEGGEFIMASGTIALAFVNITEDLRWISADLDRIVTGPIRQGHRAPRVSLHDKRKSVRTGDTAQDAVDWALRVTNSSTESLWLSVEGSDQVSSPDGTLCLAPGETNLVEVSVTGLSGANPPDRVSMDTNDPETPTRETRIFGVANQYAAGDAAPLLHMTGVNWCDEAGNCSMDPKCVDTSDEFYRGRPIFFAIFASW